MQVNGVLEMNQNRKKRQIQSETKTLLTIFMDYRGVLHHEFRPEARSVNKE